MSKTTHEGVASVIPPNSIRGYKFIGKEVSALLARKLSNTGEDIFQILSVKGERSGTRVAIGYEVKSADVLDGAPFRLTPIYAEEPKKVLPSFVLVEPTIITSSEPIVPTPPPTISEEPLLSLPEPKKREPKVVCAPPRTPHSRQAPRVLRREEPVAEMAAREPRKVWRKVSEKRPQAKTLVIADKQWKACQYLVL